MTTLADHQFEILPSEGASAGYVFGIGADVTTETFDPGAAEWVTQDSQNSRRGVTGFGRDVLGSRTWLWESSTDMDDVEGALDVLDDFSAAWAPETLVIEPGVQTALRYKVGGRYRRVFGRPRNYAAPPSNLILNGYVPITHDFQLVDSHTYDDTESSVLLPYSSSVSGGGFILPSTLPLSSLPSDGNGGGSLTVGGKARAYPIIRLNGAWTNPVFVTDHWTLRWNGTIPSGGWLEIDTRPWKLTVLDHTGASQVEGLDRRTWLEDMWFAPGTTPQINLAGTAGAGDASALVRWRNTWTSI